MIIKKPFRHLLCALVLALNICACALAQNTSASANTANQGNDLASPRELLVKQPDFVAEEVYFSTEKRGNIGFVSGHELVFARAKKGDYYRVDTGVVVVYSDSQNRTYRYNPKSKKLEEQKDENPGEEDWYDGAENPQYFARKQGIKYEVVGTEKVAGQETLKIKATKAGNVSKGGDEEEAVYLYVAKGMQNLVIATQILLPRRRTSRVLQNISLKVPDDLFKGCLDTELSKHLTVQSGLTGIGPSFNRWACRCRGRFSSG